VHLDGVKTQLKVGDGRARDAHSGVFADVEAIHWRRRKVRPHGHPVVRERDNSFSIAIFGPRPIFLFGVPDLTLRRR